MSKPTMSSTECMGSVSIRVTSETLIRSLLGKEAMKPSTDQDGCGEAKHRDNDRKREQKRELVTAL
jgi:hypothetical protein